MTLPSKKGDGLIGRRFGRLEVLQYVDQDQHRNKRYLVQCDCGRQKTVYANSLQRGATTSCDCLHKEHTQKRSLRHGLRNTPEYYIHRSMLNRCNNPHDPAYTDYGGRGITVDPVLYDIQRWLRELGGPRPSSQHTLERINNERGYVRGNICWATRKEQAQNRRNTRRLTIGGITQPLSVWADQRGLHRSTLWRRLQRGWNIEKAISTPIHSSHENNT